MIGNITIPRFGYAFINIISIVYNDAIMELYTATENREEVPFAVLGGYNVDGKDLPLGKVLSGYCEYKGLAVNDSEIQKAVTMRNNIAHFSDLNMYLKHISIKAIIKESTMEALTKDIFGKYSENCVSILKSYRDYAETLQGKVSDNVMELERPNLW